MARERPNYRDALEVQLDIIRERFPGQDFLSKEDVRRFLHWGWDKINKQIRFMNGQISIVAFADYLIRGAGKE